MNKKRILAPLVLFAFCFSFLSCKKQETVIEDDTKPEGVIVLKYWNGFTGKDGEAMDKIVANFNKEFDGEIKIESDTINWDNLFLKLIQNKGREKYSPHIVAMGCNRLGSMVDKGIVSKLDDFSTYIELKEEEYLSPAFNAGLFGSTRYSLPLDIHPTAMFYNKDLISEDEIPNTWDAFENVIKSKTDTSKGIYGYAIPSMYSITKDIYLSMLIQKGGDLIDENGNPTFNSNEGVNLLERMRTWKFSDKVSPQEVGASGDLSLFNAGKSAFYFDGPWEINTLKETSPIDFGVAPLPGSVGAGSASFAGSHQLTLIDCTTKNKYVREASYKFIKYVNQNALEWAKGGQVVAHKPTHELEEYKNLTELAPFTLEAETAQVGNIQYKYFYEAYNYMGSAVAEALSSSTTTAKEELDKKVNLFKRFVREQEEE